jgi:hypothetical protein
MIYLLFWAFPLHPLLVFSREFSALIPDPAPAGLPEWLNRPTVVEGAITARTRTVSRFMKAYAAARASPVA